MTRRDIFAAAALHSALSSEAWADTPMQDIVKAAVHCADMMEKCMAEDEPQPADEAHVGAHDEAHVGAHDKSVLQKDAASIDAGWYWYYDIGNSGYPIQLVDHPDICYLSNGMMTIAGYGQRIVYDPNKHRILSRIVY